MLWALCVLALFLAAISPLPVAAEPAPVPAGSLELDDPAAPLQPVRPRSEVQVDRVQAAALFSAARQAEQRQDLPAALRLYERALRCDAGALPVLREIVPLAFNLDRQAEAVRYALLVVEQEPTDPVL